MHTQRHTNIHTYLCREGAEVEAITMYSLSHLAVISSKTGSDQMSWEMVNIHWNCCTSHWSLMKGKEVTMLRVFSGFSANDLHTGSVIAKKKKSPKVKCQAKTHKGSLDSGLQLQSVLEAWPRKQKSQTQVQRSGIQRAGYSPCRHSPGPEKMHLLHIVTSSATTSGHRSTTKLQVVLLGLSVKRWSGKDFSL